MTKNSVTKGSGWGLTLLGLVGLIASFMLTYEKFMTLTVPDYVPACDINPLLSCASAMGSWQGELLGFPNPILGIFGYAVVITLGLLLASGVAVPRWMRAGLWLGALAGQGLIFFLMYTSLFVLGIICPWCFAVWIAQWPITVIATSLVFNRGTGFGVFFRKYRWLIIVLGYLLAAIVIVLTLSDQLRMLF